MLNAIWAMDKNWLIGNDNDLPWHHPEDLNYFKQVTKGKPVIMGRKTFDSIHSILGKPLPGRKNIVLSRSSFSYDGVDVYNNIDDLIESVKEESFVIGGSNVYSQLLEHCNKLYITFIDEEHEGNVYFPKFDLSNYNLLKETKSGVLNFSVFERL